MVAYPFMVNVGGGAWDEGELVRGSEPYTSLHWVSPCKGLPLCLHHTRRRAKYYLIVYRYMGVWVELI